jgi:hypothetical protein
VLQKGMFGAKYWVFDPVLLVYATDVHFRTCVGFLIGVLYAEFNFASNTTN